MGIVSSDDDMSKSDPVARIVSSNSRLRGGRIPQENKSLGLWRERH